MSEDADKLTPPIYYQNAQWAVTGYGVECVQDSYPFEANRLGEARDDLPDWPLHMAGKNWVDDDLFMAAFCVALQVHEGKYQRDFKSNWFERCHKNIVRQREKERRLK